MNTYQIIIENDVSYTVKGELLTQCEATGQCFIYSANDPFWKFLECVIPNTALIIRL